MVVIWPGRSELIYQRYLADKAAWLIAHPDVRPHQYCKKRGLESYSKSWLNENRRYLGFQRRLDLETETPRYLGAGMFRRSIHVVGSEPLSVTWMPIDCGSPWHPSAKQHWNINIFYGQRQSSTKGLGSILQYRFQSETSALIVWPTLPLLFWTIRGA